jgi:plasmid replication initiation protein
MEENISKIIILKQHNALTEARYEMSSLEKNIFYMLMSQLIEIEKRYYQINITELKKKLRELGQEISLGDIQEATKNLVTRIYELDEPSGDYLQVTLFASVEYKEGSDLIEIELSKTIRSYLFDLEFDFTSYQFNSALSLRSIYSKRIYEMLSQYKDLGIFEISVQKLKERLRIIDPVNKIEKFTVWSVFSKDVLELTRREISKKTDISFTYTPKKTGRKYTDIEFHIIKHETSEPITN